jgi:putative transposase
MIRLRAYKFRLVPNKTQEVLLNKTFGCVRWYWNNQVHTFNSFDKETNPQPNFKTSTQLRQEVEWMQEVSAAAIQQKEMDFKEYKKQFFSKSRKSKIGRPSFKKKSNNQSYRLPNQKFKVVGNKIQLEKIGKVKLIMDRQIPEGVKFMSVTISKTPTGKYFASILVEENIELREKTNKTIGIDVGIKTFATQSDGRELNNPKWFRESQSKLRTAQKHLSRKKLGSKRRQKQRIKVAKIHEKVSNQRNYFLHNYSTQLVKNFDVIVVEDLNVKGMVKNKRLSKSISDAGWSKFFSMVEYKSEWYGKSFVKINRWFPSSKTCFECGTVKQDLKLSDREWTCDCGSHILRDFNAAKNIERVGVDTLYNQSQSLCKTTSVAINGEAIKVY